MITRFQGDTIPMVWNFTLNNNPHDLTNVTSITFTYKENSNIINITGTATDATAGVAQFNIPTNAFKLVGIFPFDIQLVYSNGDIRTYIKADISILAIVK